MRVVVVGIIRDGERYIKSEIEHLHRVFSHIGNVEFFCVESDSSDETVNVLTSIAATHEWFTFDALGNIRDSIPERTERLAHCRNRYRVEVITRELADTDLVVVADLDRMNDLLDPNVIRRVINEGEWDVLAANQRGPYYDIWALRHPELSPNDYTHTMAALRDHGVGFVMSAVRSLYSRMITIPPTSERLRVQSAFGGLAIYRPWVFAVSEYCAYDTAGRVVVEHAPFHIGADAAGAAIYLEPRLINTGKTEHTSIPRILVAMARRGLRRVKNTRKSTNDD